MYLVIIKKYILNVINNIYVMYYLWIIVLLLMILF